MAELNNYSGPFNPHLKFEDFSKEFLIKLIRRYAAGYMKLGEFWYEKVAALVRDKKAMMENTCGRVEQATLFYQSRRWQKRQVSRWKLSSMS